MIANPQDLNVGDEIIDNSIVRWYRVIDKGSQFLILLDLKFPHSMHNTIHVAFCDRDFWKATDYDTIVKFDPRTLKAGDKVVYMGEELKVKEMGADRVTVERRDTTTMWVLLDSKWWQDAKKRVRG